MLVEVPKVTVLMTAYNAEPFIGIAIQSILDQTFTNFELLIVNDGSKDGTRAVIDRFKDNRIRVIDQNNLGAVAAANRGLQQISTPLTARMDADDVSYPIRLERQVSFLDANPKVSLVGSSYRAIAQDGEPIQNVRVLQRHRDIRRDLFVRCPMGHPTVLFRTEAVRAIGGYRPEYKVAHDWDLYWRLRGELANLPEVLLDYRIVSSGLVKTTESEDARVLSEIWRSARPPLPWPWTVVAGWRAESPLGADFYIDRLKLVEKARLKRLLAHLR
jgi:glycosyltransferase involved in cell wall biosynthesis